MRIEPEAGEAGAGQVAATLGRGYPVGVGGATP